MSTKTSNFNFTKPELSDPADITQCNENWDKVDTELKSVNDAFNNVANLHVWMKCSGDPELPIETNKTSVQITWKLDGSTTYTYANILYSDNIQVDVVGGTVSLINESTLELGNKVTDSNLSVLRGKYVYGGNLVTKGYYYIPLDATFSIGSNAVLVSSCIELTAPTLHEYVVSHNNETYPQNGKWTDGYWYKYTHQLGEMPEVPSNFDYGTADLEPGVSALETGKLYFVYE